MSHSKSESQFSLFTKWKITKGAIDATLNNDKKWTKGSAYLLLWPVEAKEDAYKSLISINPTISQKKYVNFQQATKSEDSFHYLR